VRGPHGAIKKGNGRALPSFLPRVVPSAAGKKRKKRKGRAVAPNRVPFVPVVLEEKGGEKSKDPSLAIRLRLYSGRRGKERKGCEGPPRAVNAKSHVGQEGKRERKEAKELPGVCPGFQDEAGGGGRKEKSCVACILSPGSVGGRLPRPLGRTGGGGKKKKKGKMAVGLFGSGGGGKGNRTSIITCITMEEKKRKSKKQKKVPAHGSVPHRGKKELRSEKAFSKDSRLLYPKGQGRGKTSETEKEEEIGDLFFLTYPSNEGRKEGKRR